MEESVLTWTLPFHLLLNSLISLLQTCAFYIHLLLLWTGKEGRVRGRDGGKCVNMHPSLPLTSAFTDWSSVDSPCAVYVQLLLLWTGREGVC